MNAYETIMIIRPNLIEEELEAFKEDYKSFVNAFTDKPYKLTVEDCGKKKLAYELHYGSDVFSTGYYVIYNYAAPSSESIALLEAKQRDDDRVLKFITVKRDGEAELEEEKPKELINVLDILDGLI